MAVSQVTALERDVRRVHSAARAPGIRRLILPLTSAVALMAIGLAYTGRVQSLTITERTAAVTPVNLNTVSDAAALEPSLAIAFPNASDRKAAAADLFRFVLARREAGRDLPNVGSLLDAKPSPIATAAILTAVKPSLIVRSTEAFRWLLIVHTALYLAAFWGVVLVWRLRGLRGDVLLLSAAQLLTAIGFALLVSRVDPLRDHLLFVRYTIGVMLGLAALSLASIVNFRKATFLRLSYVPLAGALLLSLLLILFGDGPGSSRARVNLGPVQPIEAIRLLLAFFLAGYFARRWELLRQIRAERIGTRQIPRWLQLPRPEYVLPIVAGVGASLLFFFLQRDLGPALFLACMFLAMYAVARARVGLALAGSALLAGGFYVGYLLNVSDTLTARVRMWQSPWDNVVRGGDQVAQGLWAVSTGGWIGTGLGLGDTRYLPAGHTDLVLSAVGEELGLIGLVAVIALSALLAVRGLRIALGAANDYGFFLATAITLFLAMPVLMMAAGVFGLTPLTGVVTPFLSYGGSAMVANLAALGVLMAISAQRAPVGDTAPFRQPVRYLAASLAAAAVVVVAVMTQVAAVAADEVAIRPHLSLQADGVRRYQYNPRVLDVARAIPRGTIYDRNGLPLATGNADAVRTARPEFAKFNIRLDDGCNSFVDPTAQKYSASATSSYLPYLPYLPRCYPLGGTTFHLLGNATTRVNWSASNTSYVERDADSRLRGFDDHATTVPLTDTDGQTHAAIRRDYRELLPLLRHRHDSDPTVRALLARPRDVRLTIDARLQWTVASLLEKYAAKSSIGHAAAIVVDPGSGHVLAVASYPFPAATGLSANAQTDHDLLLDRARYGLYPPGSIFKLVTAAAALDKGLGPNDTPFVCSYLPDGRVGARIDGWSRPVRDDVLDTHPHGRLRMHDGLVHSCNAYFAQLAVQVGARGLMDTANKLGISTASGSSVRRLRDTLPQAGYGQGDVVATPLRMVRVAAAIADDGNLRDVSLDEGGARRPAQRLISPDAAHLLARYMRDAVLTGTGRTLRDHPMRIAGKTGTAEVTGEASHSWFVGFAPFDESSKQIAFAVIVEHAGYGGTVAARLAGDIVTAAAVAGFIQ